MEDDAGAGKALGVVGGEDGVFVGDEDERGRLLPELDFPAEIGFELFRLVLAEPGSEQKLDAADDEKLVLPVFRDEGQEVVKREVGESGQKSLVLLEAGEHIEVGRIQSPSKPGGVGLLTGKIRSEEQGGTIPPFDEAGRELAHIFKLGHRHSRRGSGSSGLALVSGSRFS